jgi:hypothetical protein
LSSTDWTNDYIDTPKALLLLLRRIATQSRRGGAAALLLHAVWHGHIGLIDSPSARSVYRTVSLSLPPRRSSSLSAVAVALAVAAADDDGINPTPNQHNQGRRGREGEGLRRARDALASNTKCIKNRSMLLSSAASTRHKDRGVPQHLFAVLLLGQLPGGGADTTNW